LYHYGNKIVRQAVWDLKYYRKSTLAKELIFNDGNILQSYIEKWLTETSTKRVALVPIPQHYTKTFSRGFNQSLVVAKWIRVHIPQGTIAQILVKIKATTAQAHIENKVRRQKNLHQSMKAVKILDSSILYIVVDDVITTGSTITEAGRALRAAGAKHVYAIALAHGFTNARPASRA
jgi:predicted amidophosphoribosyltransferase